MRKGLAVVALVATSGCGAFPAHAVAPVGRTVPESAAAVLGPDRAQVFTDGTAATGALLQAVDSARVSLEAEIYEFGRRDLEAAVVAAARRGVRVRMIGDPTVDVTVATARRLEAAGVDVAFFPVETQQIDHVKLLVADNAVALFGGVNWGAQSYLNHDFELSLAGPAAARLSRQFEQDWARCGRRVEVPRAEAALTGEPTLLTSYPDDEVGRAVVASIRAATRSIEVEMYVMTDAATIAALVEAARRGVATQVLFDPGQDLNQSAMATLIPAGVRCRFYRSHGEKLHAKTAVFDGLRLLIGSANWTASGFRHNHELDALLESRALAQAVAARMDAEWAAAA